jgi:hypothetical protein
MTGRNFIALPLVFKASSAFLVTKPHQPAKRNIQPIRSRSRSLQPDRKNKRLRLNQLYCRGLTEAPTLLVIANAVLWMSALLALRLFEGNISQMATFAFAALWIIRNGLIYAILNGAKNT